jgi:NAD-dependent dihydropyrimidine dehydrogenase PreA subunit
VAGLAIITEACIDVKDRACVDVCPVQCIYEYDPEKGVLVSEEVAGSGVVETTHTPDPGGIAAFGDSLLYVNLDECTSCTACYQADVCPVGAIYSEEHLPDGSPTSARYNPADPNVGHDHTFFLQLSRDVFAD